MVSPSISNPEGNSNILRESNRDRKRRKIGIENHVKDVNKIEKIRWKSTAEQQIYSVKLIDALRQSRRNSSSPVAGRGIRETADRVLAVAGKGKTRWSRAILTSRLLRLKLRHKSKKMKTGCIRLKKPVIQKKLPELQKKVRVLSRLVPGCRKISFLNLLDEATDYIAALKMQVRVMASLAEHITGARAQAAHPDRLTLS